jgi:hypothetical protein
MIEKLMRSKIQKKWDRVGFLSAEALRVAPSVQDTNRNGLSSKRAQVIRTRKGRAPEFQIHGKYL